MMAKERENESEKIVRIHIEGKKDAGGGVQARIYIRVGALFLSWYRHLKIATFPRAIVTPLRARYILSAIALFEKATRAGGRKRAFSTYQYI